MEEDKKPGEKILDLAGDMVENYRNLITIRVVEHSSLAGAFSILGIIFILIGLFILLFAGLGFAWWLGEQLNNIKAGFFIVSGAYSILFIIVLVLAKKTLLPSFRNLIIKKIYDQD